MREYVFQTGRGGAARLDIVESMFGEASRQFLAEVGLRDGLRVLDVGCGTGALTCWIAQVVGNRGRVTAVDADSKQLAVARKDAEQAGLTNTDFVQGRLGSEDLALGGFHLVHCRLVLMHVSDADLALGLMARAARPGGILACEETVASSAFAHPRNEVIFRMSRLFCELGKQRALDFDVGDDLFTLMSRHTSRVVAARFVQPMVPLPMARRFLTLGAVELKAVLLAAGLVTEKEAEEFLRGIQTMSDDPTAYYAPGRMAQVAGMVGGDKATGRLRRRRSMRG